MKRSRPAVSSTRFGRVLTSCAVAIGVLLPFTSAIAADFVGFVGEGATVSTAGGDRYVIDVYAEFVQSEVNVVNVYDATISNTNGTAFFHSDLNTIQSLAGTWSPAASIAVGGANPAADTFVTIGGSPGSSNTTTLDPNFTPATASVPPAESGWYNSNPGNNQGLADASTRRVFVGRFVTATPGDTLNFTASITFADYIGGVNGTAQQVQGSVSIPYTTVACDTLLANAASTSIDAGGTSSAISVSVDVADATCDWSATSDSAWLTLTAASGTGDGAFTFSVAENTDTSPRSGTITVSSGTASDASIVVTQAAGIALWIPSELSSLAAWWDASELTGVADGGLVSTLPDASGNGLSLTASGNARPTYRSSSQNGLGVLEFDGTSDVMTRGENDLFRNVAGATVYVVRMATSTQTGRSDLFGATFSNRPTFYRASLDLNRVAGKVVAGMRRRSTDGLTTAVSVSNYQIGSFVIHGGVWDFTGGQLSQWVDGELSGTGSAGGSGSSQDVGSAEVKIGGWSSGSSNFEGRIGEVVVLEEALSANDRQSLEGYLAHKWGIASSLPAGHPYRNAPPGGSAACTTVAAVADSTTVDASGTSSPVSVAVTVATASCDWSATSNQAWLTVSGAVAIGDGTFTYSVSATDSATPRVGTITVSSGIATPVEIEVTQAGDPCFIDTDGDGTGDCSDGCPNDPNKTDPGLCGCGVDDSASQTWYPDADSDGYGDASSSGTVSCTQPSGHVSNALDCNDADPSVNPAASEVCDDSIDNNCNGQIDEGCAVPCDTLAATAGTTTFGHLGAASAVTASVDVADASCGWSASSDAAWIVLSAASGTGDGSFTFTVNANADPSSRSGSITVSSGTATDVVIAISQDAAPGCVVEIDPESRTASFIGSLYGETFGFSIAASGDACGAWTVAPSAADALWISITSGGSGTGAGAVVYEVMPNLYLAARSGTIEISHGGEVVATHAVSQAGPAPECLDAVSFAPESRSAGGAAASYTVDVSTNDAATCAWYAESDVAWISIIDGSSFTGSGTITYLVEENTSGSSRVGTITIGNGAGLSVHTVTQGIGSCIDTDGDGTDDCSDGCPNDPNKTDPGLCGCGVDDSASQTWYPDADSDGYGDASSSGTVSCTQPSGHVSNALDCNDADPSVNPAASELCGDSIDNNCNGQIDEDCPSADAWDPTALASLKAWWDAGSLTGAAEGDPIGSWPDASGSGFGLSASGGARPTFRASAQNGLGVLEFDGSSDAMSTSGGDLFQNLGGATIYAVRLASSGQSGRSDIVGATFANRPTFYRASLDLNRVAGKSVSSMRRFRNSSLTVASSSDNFAIGSYEIQGAVIDWSGGLLSQYVDGVSAGSESYGPAGTSENVGSAEIKVGAWSSGTSGFEGRIAEIVVVHEALSTCDRQKLEGYLAHRWGLEASLPADHPYRSTAPTTESCASGLAAMPDATVVPADGTSEPVQVAVEASGSASNWEVLETAAWLSVDSGGDGKTSFSYTAAANDGSMPRVATITVSGDDGASVSFEVTQLATCQQSGSGDCDQDGVSDACAIAWGLAIDADLDGVPDGCEPSVTVRVPEDYPSIQDAIDAAADGWTIRVQPGVHRSAVTLVGKSVVIESEAGAAQTVLEPEGSIGTIVQLIDAGQPESPATIRGFTIRGGSGGTPISTPDGTRFAGGGVLAIDSVARIEDCVIEGNLAHHGGGVAAVGGSLELDRCVLAENVASVGGGAWLHDVAAVVTDADVHGNVAMTGAGIAITGNAAVSIGGSSICGNAGEEIAGEFTDLGGNGACTCVGDLSGDGVVDGVDLSILMGAWGSSDEVADLSGDGVVDGVDLSMLMSVWGAPCDP